MLLWPTVIHRQIINGILWNAHCTNDIFIVWLRCVNISAILFIDIDRLVGRTSWWTFDLNIGSNPRIALHCITMFEFQSTCERCWEVQLIWIFVSVVRWWSGLVALSSHFKIPLMKSIVRVYFEVKKKSDDFESF